MQYPNEMNQNQNSMPQSEYMPAPMSHGGHELFDAHEILGSMVGCIDNYTLYEGYAQDNELRQMIQAQSQFLNQMYNTAVESLKTGQKPSEPTQVYNMDESNNVTFGLKPGAPKKPIQSTSELTEDHISSFMLGQMKGLSSLMAMAAGEITNPVLRRVIADSIPNTIEMSYEIFLYRNDRGYYQVPQLTQQDMQTMINSFAPSSQQPMN
ncbi:spore coat protein [Halobacillus salinarum]|uniref:Spore coat protein n=1 Tax=Halobacillus salinarum TaxID=2932257 RepID=A0ABY4EFD7_9BACI|nr:spore coat protein [Halobacillus salinarum]UOQ42618.1 spore coat protein [Halobacillus salinarum]